jgi:uroporphyrinogen III methyltransferase/synthase
VEALLLESPRGGRVLIPRAAEARELLPEALSAAGMEVQVVAAYRTQAVEGTARQQLRECVKEQVDTVIFTSSSMVDSVVEALGQDAKTLLSERTVASIGPITSKTAQRHGLRVDVEARVFTVDGLLDALEEHRSGRDA